MAQPPSAVKEMHQALGGHSRGRLCHTGRRGSGALYSIVLAPALWRRLPGETLRQAVQLALPLTGCITLLSLAQQAGVWGVSAQPSVRVGFVSPR